MKQKACTGAWSSTCTHMYTSVTARLWLACRATSTTWMLINRDEPSTSLPAQFLYV